MQTPPQALALAENGAPTGSGEGLGGLGTGVLVLVLQWLAWPCSSSALPKTHGRSLWKIAPSAGKFTEPVMLKTASEGGNRHGTARHSHPLPYPACTHGWHQPGPTGTDWDGDRTRPTEVVAALVRHLDMGGPSWDLGHIHVPKITWWGGHSQGRARAQAEGTARGQGGTGLGREGTGHRGALGLVQPQPQPRNRRHEPSLVPHAGTSGAPDDGPGVPSRAVCPHRHHCPYSLARHPMDTGYGCTDPGCPQGPPNSPGDPMDGASEIPHPPSGGAIPSATRQNRPGEGSPPSPLPLSLSVGDRKGSGTMPQQQ